MHVCLCVRSMNSRYTGGHAHTQTHIGTYSLIHDFPRAAHVALPGTGEEVAESTTPGHGFLFVYVGVLLIGRLYILLGERGGWWSGGDDKKASSRGNAPAAFKAARERAVCVCVCVDV